MDADVIIVGGGPVGLTLALDFASRGIGTIVFDRRMAGDRASVKTNHISARSMETYRRLGIAGDIRAVGLPADHPHDISYRTRFVGYELGRTRLGSTASKLAGTDDGADSEWPTPEPPQRVNQTFVEPILFAAAQASSQIQIIEYTEVNEVRQTDGYASVLGRNLHTGLRTESRAQFVIGCDGPRSTVRRRIGATLEGPPLTGRALATLIRAPRLLEKASHERAWAVITANPEGSGGVITVDGEELFLVQTQLTGDQTYEEVDREDKIRTFLGGDVDFEIVSIEDYTSRGLVASTFRSERVFLAGDAAHIWLPFAGYGMNAGIADAVDLAWQLASYLDGWTDSSILDVYEIERRPVTSQVASHAMGFLPEMITLSNQVPVDLEDPTPSGEKSRTDYGEKVKALWGPQYVASGLNFGYFYEDSPIIVYDETPAPSYGMSDFEVSTVPGCRAPHVWLDNGHSLWDSFGSGYTLIRADSSLDVTSFERAAADLRVPLTVVDVGQQADYDRPLVLARPDCHVAWRGHQSPSDPEALLKHLTARTA